MWEGCSGEGRIERVEGFCAENFGDSPAVFSLGVLGIVTGDAGDGGDAEILRSPFRVRHVVQKLFLVGSTLEHGLQNPSFGARRSMVIEERSVLEWDELMCLAHSLTVFQPL